MKTKLQTLLFIFFVQISFGQFITTWETTKDNQEITIPTNWGEYTYNYSVNWGDGTTSSGLTQDAKHTYATKDTYTVTITGTFPAIYFGIGGSRLRIKTIEQWGNNPWLTMAHAFVQCDNLSINATDSPNLSNATNMTYMFFTAGINQSLDNWDVSNITDMSYMFSNSDFNQDISSWDVSNVRNMEGMFFGTYFNQDIGGWDVSNVTNMKSMFGGTDYFDQDIGNWNVSKVTSMSRIFSGSLRFNQDIGGWNVISVTDMEEMFYNAVLFNQNIGSWNVINVTNMSTMFRNAISFNQDIGNWNVSSVTNMRGMFNSADIFNQNIGGWNVSNVTDMEEMFKDTNAFNQDIGNWNVSNVTTMESMFDGDRVVFNQDIGSWDVSSVTDMEDMFRDANSFNQDIGNWNVSSVTNMEGMFYGARDFNKDISGWNVSNVTDMEGVFANTGNFNQDISDWDVGNVTTMSGMFSNALAFNQNLSNWNVSKVKRMTGMLNNSDLSRSNYDALLKGWATQTLKSNVSLGASGLQYCVGETARTILTSAPNNWNISGDTKDCIDITVIPDANFEQYLIDENIDSDGTINGQVLTTDIENITKVVVKDKNITDLTGIEDFINLIELDAANNQISSIYLSKNVLLEKLFLANNQLTSIDLSKNTKLKNVDVGENNLTSLEIHFLTDLETLSCYKNQLTLINTNSNTKLTSLISNENQLKQVDLRQNTNLFWLDVDDNNLESLGIKNGNNSIITIFSATGNPNLTCIEVDNASYSNANWPNKDGTAFYATDCAPANDDCANAIPLVFGQQVLGDVNSGTANNNPSCATVTVLTDVWYSVTVPATGEFSVQGTPGEGVLKFAIYASCTSISPIACGTSISLNNLTVGTKFYLKIWIESASSKGTSSKLEAGTFTLKVEDSSVLSVDNFYELKNNLLLYPNPASSSFSVKLENENTIDKIQIFNSIGVKMFEEKNINSKQKINTSKFAKGIYIVKATSGNRSVSKKLIIK
ncbi:BspA family leucine-rich repeat surface protein [Polaribacter septentrionalilitoris]|uniref:BspA family leucine-rich repeat surface protein n=1 Tax=Polaribacter septentrionalilitoris TaxID=2494657 RepID=UPI00135871AA|nr:BspA family leucine-rich repeat surface protein [Polaribacter septentrionalilitoris]